MRITRIGGPTMLVELADWRILIDPTFDPPGRRYPFGLGTASIKTLGPSLSVDQVGYVDLVLLSHDHHADNLDHAGRAMLPSIRHIVTTASGARRLKMRGARGLLAGQTLTLDEPDKEPLTVTATCCRHGPPLSRPIVGDVIGFALNLTAEHATKLWISGDTVLYPALRRTARELDVDVAILNAGGVRFGITGPLHYTMTGADIVELIKVLQPRVVIPAHYDGWSHFRDGPSGLHNALAAASPPIQALVRWLPDGEPTQL